ncbi:hemolysin III family protein [Paraneptunicella aestuarii]|uniref:PAQR family membrane homeostasis protein TrhA n=1 Tax=Paraneptunicella aestuarii TaxID=2831148 RepID=UPI001E3F73D7|nr:hemolysin III family protein [Paraneptunicella aestuarii]UAA39081.1 hemolysin III family protein [Paraneptunicella aestuarii]
MKYYSPTEERINVVSHLIGLGLSVVGLLGLVLAANANDIAKMSAAIIFGSSLIVLYAASSKYHSAKLPEERQKLRIFDHASIFILIAGTYTPYALVTLSDTSGWLIFGIVWGLAFVGIVLKLFFTGKYKIASTGTYLVMGWLIVFFADELLTALHPSGFYWLAAGGGAYTLGAILHGLSRVPFNHAIFHFLVLIGSACHYISIYAYVI